jgi:trigger factor
MKVTVTPKTATSEVEIEVLVPPTEFAPYLSQAAKKLSTASPLNGFRPGHAPLNKVIEKFGQERVLREAMDEALPHFFVQAVVEEDVSVISRPNITVKNLGLDADFHFLAIAHTVPSVKLGNPGEIKVVKGAAAVTDQEVAEELKYLAKMRSTPLAVARPAEKGDILRLDFKVTIGGRVVEGGQSDNHLVNLGEGHFIPDFENQLVGLSAGETREFDVSFPADFPQTHYRGELAHVWVKLHSVEHPTLPALDDDFARSLGKFKDLAHLKDELTKGISKEKERKVRDQVHRQISEQLVSLSTFGPFPDVLVDREIDRQLEELSHMLAVQQKSLEHYLLDQQKTLPELRAELKPQAELNLKTSLVLRTFADEEKIEIAAEDIEKKAARYLEQFSGTKDAAAKIDPEELRHNLTSVLRNQQALKKLAELVTVEEEKPKL